MAGQTATFTVTASGTPPLACQWRKNDVDIAGAIGFAYTTPATVPADSGTPSRCLVTNGFGNALGNPATLKVNPAP